MTTSAPESSKNFRDEVRPLLKLAVPIAIGQVTHMLFQLIDTVMIGHVGTTELAGAAFANSVFIIFLIFGTGFSNSTSPLVAVAVGQKNFKGARRIFFDSLRVNSWVGTIVSVLAWSILLIFERFGQTPEVVTQGRIYYALIVVTILPSMFFQCTKQYLECLGHATVPMISAIGGLLSNVVLNWIFIFGAGPIPAFGVAGAAIGTILARLAMLAHMAYYIRNDKRHRAPESTQEHFPDVSRKYISRRVFKLGFPTASILVLEVGAFAFSTMMAGWIGSVQLAAHQVTLSLASLTFMVPLGIGFASSIRVGTAIGRGDRPGARLSGQVALSLAICFMTTCAFTLSAGRYVWPRLFTSDLVVIELAAGFLLISALFQISDGVQVVSAGLLRALHDVRLPLVITFIAYWVIALPLGYTLAFKLGLGAQGIWWGLAGGLSFAAILLSTRFFILLRNSQMSARE